MARKRLQPRSRAISLYYWYDIAPLSYPLGRIVKLHPGPKDNSVRVVTVKIRDTLFIRSVNKLILVPTEVPLPKADWFSHFFSLKMDVTIPISYLCQVFCSCSAVLRFSNFLISFCEPNGSDKSIAEQNYS